MKKFLFLALALSSFAVAAVPTERVTLAIDPETFQTCVRLDYMIVAGNGDHVEQQNVSATSSLRAINPPLISSEDAANAIAERLRQGVDTPETSVPEPTQVAALSFPKGQTAVLAMNCYNEHGESIGAGIKRVSGSLAFRITPDGTANNWDSFEGMLPGVSETAQH